MIIQFTVWDWRDIINYTGAAVSLDEKRTTLQRIRLKCENNKFEAVGCDGFHLSRLRGSCKMTEETPVEILMLPIKAPAKTNSVSIVTEAMEGIHLVYFYDKANEIVGFNQIPIITEPYMEVDSKFIEPAIQRQSEYSIGVNPKYMIEVLTAMKDADTVILEFGNQVQPFLVHPFNKEKPDRDFLSLILPVRTWGSGKYED